MLNLHAGGFWNKWMLEMYNNKVKVLESWNNGKEVPRWGVAEIHKMSPSTTRRCE